jgi:hypothetical protein
MDFESKEKNLIEYRKWTLMQKNLTGGKFVLKMVT